MQVSWSIGSEGALTVASRNHTHGFLALPYAAKRKEENLDADATRAALNLETKGGRAVTMRNWIATGNAVAKSIVQFLRS